MTDYFLVRIADDPITFLSELLEGHPYGVTEPTLAAQMSYEDASDLVRYLRLKGYSDSCVLNIYGVPPSARDLARMRRMQEENVKCVVIVDNKFYFTGQQVGKHERLTADIKDALQLSRKVAEGIREKLRGTGLRNVRMEEIEPEENAAEEVERIWGQESPTLNAVQAPVQTFAAANAKSQLVAQAIGAEIG